ncbi:MAG: c-type cytochrome [Hyphomicrobiaceae bacterium]
MIWWLSALALVMVMGLHPATAGDWEVGRAIYYGRTTSRSPAFLGNGKIPVPLSRVACARCHGADGAGRAEGASEAPAISGNALHVLTQRRPVYDLQAFEEALKLGKDSAGRELDAAMPRFKLDKTEMHALFTYLGHLYDEQRGGIRDTTVRVAIAHESGRERPAAALRDRARTLWERLSLPFIHGRGLEVETIELDLSGPDLDRRLRASRIAALVFPIVKEDRKLLAAAASAGVPVLFPLFPLLGDESRHVVRGISAPRDVQIRALLGAIDRAVPVVDMAGSAHMLGRQITPSHPHLTLGAVADLPQEFILLGPPGEMLQRNIRGRTIHGLADDLGASLVPFLEARARVQLAEAIVLGKERDGRQDVMIAAGLAALSAALLQAGRQLTRASLIEAFDNVSVRGGRWPELNYRRFPLAGTDWVRMRRIGFDR